MALVKINTAIRKIKAEAMRTRFTFDERVLIEESLSSSVKVFKNDLAAKQTLVNLDSPKLELAMALLELENCLIPKEGQTIKERRAELLQDGTTSEVS
jgi:hypothetical protein